MSNKLSIHGSILGELGKRFESKSDISPLHLQDQYVEMGSSELEKANICGDDNSLLNPQLEIMIQKLASPSFFGRFRYTEGIGVKETTVYYDLDGELICGMTTGMSEIVTLDPSINIGDEMDQVMQLIGQSVIQHTEFEEDLSVNESIAFASMIDLYRKHMFESLGLSRPFDPELTRSEDVLREINNDKAQWIMWLTFIVKQSVGLGKTFELDDMTKGLDGLVDKKLLIKDGMKYKLTEEVEALAIRMHLTDNIIVANCGFASSKKVHIMSFISAQFGLKDILMIDGSGELVNITSVSASQIIKVLMDFMYTPMAFFADNIEEVIENKPEVVVAASPLKEVPKVTTAVKEFKFCVHCGGKMSKNATFCSSCGQKVK